MNENDVGRASGGNLERPKVERDELGARLAMCEAVQMLPGRPVLAVSDALLEGYLLLESDERRFTAIALSRHGDLVTIWYQYLKLLKAAILGIGKTTDIPVGSLRNQLALRFIAVSGGTVKLILDAGLAGYYAQAYGLIRHLFETWFRLEYIRLRPEEASRWFVGDDGSDPKPPNEGTIHSYVESHTKGGHKENATLVKKKISDFNNMAHPSPTTLQQTMGVSENLFEVGANYNADLCVGVLHDGASGLRFILTSLNDVIPQQDEWNETRQEVMARHIKVLDWEKHRLADYGSVTKSSNQ